MDTQNEADRKAFERHAECVDSPRYPVGDYKGVRVRSGEYKDGYIEAAYDNWCAALAYARAWIPVTPERSESVV